MRKQIRTRNGSHTGTILIARRRTTAVICINLSQTQSRGHVMRSRVHILQNRVAETPPFGSPISRDSWF